MSTRHIAAESARLHDLTPEGSSGRASKRFRQKLASDGFTVDEGFRLKPGYLYTVVRAISARVNQNYDGWPSDELKKSYKTFIGKPCFVNHENHDPTKARGVVVAARYVESGMDKYIEVVQEIDAGRFPKLAHEIKTGGLDSVSMGAEAGFTICSYCHNKATDLHDMCDHVQNHKGKTLTRFDKKTGKKEDVLVFESCHKISFFELSYVFEPADETAVASKVVVAGLKKSASNPDPVCLECGEPVTENDYGWSHDDDSHDDGHYVEPDWSGPTYSDADISAEEAKDHIDHQNSPAGKRERAVDLLTEGFDFDPDSDPLDPRRITSGNDLTVPAPPGTPTVDQSVIDNTPVVNLTPATELTGHEAPGLAKSSSFDADLAEITAMVRSAESGPPAAGSASGTSADGGNGAQVVLDTARADAAGSKAQNAAGSDYELGGAGPGSTNVLTGQPAKSTDCSGIAGDMLNTLTGKPADGEAATDSEGVRFNTTSDFAAMGFEPGAKPGAFNMGVNPKPGAEGHMSVQLPSGANVESSSTDGVEYGAGARGVNDKLFTQQWHLPGTERSYSAPSSVENMLLPGYKQSSFDADLAEITKLAAQCPPGIDCNNMPDLNNELSQGGGASASDASIATGGQPGETNDNRLLPGTQALNDKLKELYPGIEIGGYREDPAYPDEHPAGKALDFMTTDVELGNKALQTGWEGGADYAIWQNKMHYSDGTTKPYTGPNPHTDHVHFHHPGEVAPTTRAAGKYTKDDFNHPSGKMPWDRDTDTDAEDAAAIEIEAMMHTAGATDDYEKWKAEFGEAADNEHGVRPVLDNPNLRRWIDEIDRAHRKWAKTADLDVIPENSQKTQRPGTEATYRKVHDFFDAVGAPNDKGSEGVLDYGSGLGHSGRWGHTYEPHPDVQPGAGNYPTWIDPKKVPAGNFNRVTNIHVLNVVPPEIRDQIVDGVKRAMAPGGHAVFVTRSRSDVDSTKNKIDAGNGDPGAYHIFNPDKPDDRTYQKGFAAQELHQYISDRMGPGCTVSLIPGENKISAPAVHVVKNEARLSRRKVRSTALKKIARSRAKKLAFGEIEAPMAVNTMREEGSAPEDDDDDFERYVDPPKDLQTPDLSQAGQVDREQEIAGAPTDQMGGVPGPADPAAAGAPQAPQQQYMTLQIPMPSEAPQVPQQAAPPVMAQPPMDPTQDPAAGPPQQMTASLLDYFDNYYGRRVANWMDAIEARRDMNPAEVADYRRQSEKLSTLENGREHSTTNRNPTKGTAKMARSTIASRSKVARAGRRQHLAEGPFVDGGPYGRNDEGEQEEAFISQVPPPQPGDFVTEEGSIHNTEHNLVARVQQGRAQLLRDAQQLASLQQRRAFDEAGGPTAEVVDPTVHTGPEGEALTGTGFVSADPNDGVVPTNPKDASLRAFQAFDGWLAQKTGKSSRRHTEANIKKAAAAFSREAGISPQMLFPALGIVLREARKTDKKANSKGAAMRKRADEKLEVAAPDGRVDVEAPVENVTSAEAQASQFDLRDFGDNAGDNVAKPDLSTDQNWAPGEASGQKAAHVKTAGGLLAMRCAEGMIAAGLEPNDRERKYALAAEFENMNRGLIQDRVALLERFAAVRQADLRRVASGSSRGAARSPIPAGLGGGTRTAAAGMRTAAHDPSNDSSLFI